MALRTLIAFACTLFSAWVSAQSGGNPAFTHFSVKDGLPARTVYDIIQDNNGFIWMATELGICRFDGYQFWQPPAPEEVQNSIFHLSKDAIGRIWFQRLNGSLWHFDGDSVRPWVYNHLLPKYRKKATKVGHYDLDTAGQTVWIAIDNNGIVKIDQYGRETIIGPPEEYGSNTFICKGDRGYMFGNCLNFKEETNSKTLSERVLYNGYPTFWQNGDHWQKLDGFRLFGVIGQTGMITCSDSTLIFNMRTKQDSLDFFLLQNGRLLWKRTLPWGSVDKMQKMPSGEIFIGISGGERGVACFKNIEAVRNTLFTRYLSGYSVTSVCMDASGGYWFGTHEDGIFYAPDISIRTWSNYEGNATSKVLNLAYGKKDQIFLGLRSGLVQCFQPSTGDVTTLPRTPLIYNSSDLIYDPVHDRVMATSPMSMFFQHGKWRPVCVVENEKFKYHANGNTVTLSPDKKRWLFAGTDRVNIISNDNKSKSLYPYNLKWRERSLTAFEDPLGRIWISTVNGLYQHINEMVVPRKDLHPLMADRGPERICSWKNDHLVFGTRNKGVLIWGPDSQFVRIGAEQGLQYQILKHLCEDAQGNLWVAANTGLFKLSRNEQAQWSIRHYTTAHGLPDSEVNDILPDSSGYLWVATSNGLCHFHEPAPLTAQPQPFLSEVLINGNAINIRRENALRYDENNVKVGFLTLNYRQLGHISYRYRLHDDDAWNYTLQHQVEFSQLAPGRYRFEVQSQDETGIWSESGTWAFKVLPPWWATWWFRGLAALVVGALAYFWYSRRIEQINQRTALEKQVRELENAALQAQMNPHFIFNCLNSIQKFIVSNDADSAVIYLANFAKLVRSTLHASVEGRITLLEEVRMLGNYLSLEQLRFKNVFEYRIAVDDSLDQMSVVLPPMMVQPFVENAIIHGMKQKGRDGFIQIRYAQPDASTLLITVEDNGPGMGERNSSGQKSLGRNLTARRLELLNQQSKDSAITVQYTTPDAGSGVLVQLRLPLRIETPQHLTAHTP